MRVEPIRPSVRIPLVAAAAALSISASVALTASAAAAQSETIRQWQYTPATDGAGCELALREVETPRPGPGEVQVRIRATSFNGRDRYVFSGACGPGGAAGMLPLSDGAGEVIAVGEAVTRFEVGDRVVGTYFAEHWIDGDRPAEADGQQRGVPAQGMLSEVVVGSEDGFVAIPENLSYEEAATLPVAAVTAYTGLFEHGDLQPDEYVLLEGTGGVSTFGLLFSVAAGAKPIITSSSDEKLKRARALGAVGTVNYRRNPDWHEEVRRLTGGVGVQHVLEIGGEETRPLALEALGIGGHMAVIGGLTGFGGAIPVGVLFEKDLAVTSYHVGSRADFEAMNRFIAGHGIQPVVDRVFEFDDAPAAFDFYMKGDFMGKVVIRL